MAYTVALPRSDAALDSSGNQPSREYFRFFSDLVRINIENSALPTRVDALDVRVRALEENPGTAGRLVGPQSVRVDGLLSNGVATVRLAGDVDQPAALSFYGALALGGRGWQGFAANNFAARDNGDGTLSLDLADLADSGTGAALVKITRDAKGRISGTEAATTDDLAEGLTNLYFTATRVRAALLTGLSLVTSAVITAADTVLSAFGKLQAQITSHTSNTSNPHGVTKAQVGLGNVDNTSDTNKPVSTAQATADALRVLKSGDTMTGQLNINLTGGSPPGMLPGLAGSYVATQSTPAFAQFDCFGASTGLLFRAAKGTLSAPVALGPGNFIGQFQARGYNGSGFSGEAASVAFLSGEGFSATRNGAYIQFRTTGNGTTTPVDRWAIGTDGTFVPNLDNAYDVGSSPLRGRVAYFATGAINTSDAREKTVVNPLTSVELAAAADLARAIGTYQWLDMVAEKGADVARHHAGLAVQQAIAIMQAHGLDPFRYGFICYDQWPETPEVVSSWPARDAVLDDDGNVITPAVEAGSEVTQAYRPAGDRYSFRTDELSLFLARGFAARLDALEATP